MPEMTKEDFEEIGRSARQAMDGNLVVGSFAAEMINESYPLSKSMWDALFKGLSDEELGRRFVSWSDFNQALGRVSA